MPLFHIRNRRLVPASGGQLASDHLDLDTFNEVLAQFGCDSTSEPSEEGIVVLVSGGQPPIRSVPKEVIVVANIIDASDATQEVYLFWAVDEDDEDKEVIVVYNAHLARPPRKGYREHQYWWKVGFDEWLRDIEDCDYLWVRAFRSAVDASAYVLDEGFVFIPTEIEGWRGAAIHGENVRERSEELISGRDPRIVKAMGMPDGFDLKAPFEAAVREENPGYLWMLKLTKKEGVAVPSIMSESPIERVVVTADGGIFIVVRVYEGEDGYKLLGRQFTHEEAKHLDL